MSIDNIKCMFSQEIILDRSNIDNTGHYKLPYIFSLIQNIACLGSEDCEFGLDYLSNKGLMWVILKQRLVFLEDIDKYRKLTFHTYPGDTIKFIYTRHIFATNSKGEVVLRYYSTWAVLDINTRHIAIPEKTGIIIKAEHYPDELNSFLDKNFDINAELCDERRVRYSDIDLNNHLNNIRYLEYVLDINDSEYYKKHIIKDIELNYLKEIKENQIIQLYILSSTEKRLLVKGTVNNCDCFIAYLLFK